MPREKKYTKTIAVRVTQEEWELIEYDVYQRGYESATDWLRWVIDGRIQLAQADRKRKNKKNELFAQYQRQQQAKRDAAAAKRAAKKAGNVNA